MQFNTYSHTNVVPVGLGIGKVIQLEGGSVLNGYVEVQPSIFRSGRGARLADRNRHPNPVPDELDERLEVLKSRNNERVQGAFSPGHFMGHE